MIGFNQTYLMREGGRGIVLKIFIFIFWLKENKSNFLIAYGYRRV